jgi:hypothetical protein
MAFVEILAPYAIVLAVCIALLVFVRSRRR